MVLLTWFVKQTRTGKAMRAVAQNQIAARLMGIPADAIIGRTSLVGGALGGVASVVYALYNNTIYFQMGYRAGIDAFASAVLGGLCVGLVRAVSISCAVKSLAPRSKLWTEAMSTPAAFSFGSTALSSACGSS